MISARRHKPLGANVLFLRMPHRTQTTDPNVFADVAAVVGSYGYDLLDLHDVFDTIGLDRCADFMDSYHLNAIGMETFTAWFGQYLSERYDLTTAHSETVTAEWQRWRRFYGADPAHLPAAGGGQHQTDPQRVFGGV